METTDRFEVGKGSKVSMSGNEKGVYRDDALYVIALRGGLRKNDGGHTIVFWVPYRTVLGERSVDFMVAADIPPDATRAAAVEVTLNPRGASDNVLSELLLLDWHVERQAAKGKKKSIGQPVGIWNYKGDMSLIASVAGGRTRSLRKWLELSRVGDDLGLAARMTAQARPPVIQALGPYQSLNRHDGWSTRKVFPVESRNLFRNKASKHPRAASTSDRKPEDDVVSAMRLLPDDLKEYAKKVSFRDLRQFMDDCLKGNAPDKEVGGTGLAPRCPGSEEEFLGLVRLLREKADHPELPDLAPDPGPAPPFPPFKPSEALNTLQGEAEQLDERLRAALRNPEATKRSIKKLRRKVGISGAEAEALKISEIAEYKKLHALHLHPHRKALAAREQSLRNRHEVAGRRHELRERRQQIATRVERDVRRAFEGGASGGGDAASRSAILRSATRLTWVLLPPGQLTVERLRSHYAELARREPDVRYEPERIEKAFSLKPEQCYVGRGEFDGYVVFTFAYTDKALLECPIHGNAVYILGRDWRRLARLSKGALLAGGIGGATKIVHKGDWFARVKATLGKSRDMS